MTSVCWILAAALAVLSLIYGVTLYGFVRGLLALRRSPKRIRRTHWPSVSVAVPARNEAEVLQRTLESLFKQRYPGPWEIVVTDDRSTDETPRILAELAATHKHLRVVSVTEPAPRSPKKNALALGIRHSTGEIIVTTDADCVHDPLWLRGLVSRMTDNVGVVAGLTVFDLPVDYVPAWQKIQWLDFFAQQVLAAGAIGGGVPSSCNGSNLAYRRTVYNQISGFGQTTTLVSGDDVLFAQRVVKFTRWKVAYATDRATIVRSLPVLGLRDMLYQRIRWASKGLAYRRSMLAFLGGLYLYYVLWLAAWPAVVVAPQILPIVAAACLWKLSWDYSILRLGCRLFKQQHLLRYFLPFEILHTLTSPVFGMAGLFVPFRWKGEWYRTAKLPRGWRRRLVRVRRLVRYKRTQRVAA